MGRQLSRRGFWIPRHDTGDMAVFTKLEEIKYNPKYRAFANALGIDMLNIDGREVERLVFLYDWARSNTKGKEDNVDAVIRAMQKAENELPTSPGMQKRVDHLYHWVRLNQDKERMKEERKQTDTEQEKEKKKKPRSRSSYKETWKEKGKEEARRELDAQFSKVLERINREVAKRLSKS